MGMEPIRWEHDTLYLLDQRQLPGQTVWMEVHDYRQVVEAISTLAVRGAPAIGLAASYALVLAALELQSDPEHFSGRLMEARQALAASRPTAVNLTWALDQSLAVLEGCPTPQRAAELLLEKAKALHRENNDMTLAIGRHGAQVLPADARVLTHCNAGALATCGLGTALAVIRCAHRDRGVKMVYVDETRPLLQGARLTAWELRQDCIPATLITDSMAPYLMARREVDAVVVGCDRMAANGDFANKIGTYALAVSAYYHGIPFYTALPTSTIDFRCPHGGGIPIEERAPDEVRAFAGVATAPEGMRVFNPSFDVTPHALLTGIITQHGVLYPPFGENLARLRAKDGNAL